MSAPLISSDICGNKKAGTAGSVVPKSVLSGGSKQKSAVLMSVLLSLNAADGLATGRATPSKGATNAYVLLRSWIVEADI